MCGDSQLFLDRGADVNVATDGNFSHRHLIKGGDCPKFYEPLYFLTKQYVDDIGARIDAVRKRKPKTRPPKVPDEAVDDCEKTHEAARGTNVKTSMAKHDDAGLMALVCRHDIPLFLANIDTPGEQQKYSVALIEHLFSLLPPKATVAVLYDVACVLDRSLHLVRKCELCAKSSAHNFTVQHSPREHYEQAWSGNECNALIQTPMGLSASLQPSHSTWFWFDRWRGHGAILVPFAEAYPTYPRMCREFSTTRNQRLLAHLKFHRELEGFGW